MNLKEFYTVFDAHWLKSRQCGKEKKPNPEYCHNIIYI